MPKLIVEKGTERGREFVLSGDTTLISGRHDSAQLLLNDSMASREHFSIEPRDGGYHLVDMKSRNGTYVNGKRVDEHRLKSGDRIQVGETVFSFVDEAVEGIWGDLAGKTIGGYAIQRRVGRGGMGTVYEAVQLSLDRTVAFKVLSPDRVADERFREMFLKEARAAGKMNHPNIVSVYDVGNEGDIYYISMEFIPGGSLRDRLIGEQKMDPDEAASIITDAARALEYAEQIGIVHRDIKPDNLMIAENGSVKICDLGLAKEVSTTDEPNKKETICGSPLYLSPEQAQGKPADARSDLYALGATFYRLLAGVPPFSGRNIREILDKQVQEIPEPVSHHNSDVSPEMERLVNRLLEKEPARRFPSAAALQIALDSLHPARLTQSSFDLEAEKHLQRRQHRRLLYGAGGLIGLLLVALLILSLGGQDPEPTPLPDRNPGNGNSHPGASSLLTQANEARAQGNQEAALRLYGRLLKLYPHSREAEEAREQSKIVVTKIEGQKISQTRARLTQRVNLAIENREGETPHQAYDRFRALSEEIQKAGEPVYDEPFRDGKNILQYCNARAEALRLEVKSNYQRRDEQATALIRDGRFLDAFNTIESFRRRATESQAKLFLVIAVKRQVQISQAESRALDAIIQTAETQGKQMAYSAALATLKEPELYFQPDNQKRIRQVIGRIQEQARTTFEETRTQATRLVDAGDYAGAIAQWRAIETRYGRAHGMAPHVDRATVAIAWLVAATQRIREIEKEVFTLAATFQFAKAKEALENRRDELQADPALTRRVEEQIETQRQLLDFKKTLLQDIEQAPKPIYLRSGGRVKEALEDKLWIQEGIDGTRARPWSDLSQAELTHLVDQTGHRQEYWQLYRLALLATATGRSKADFTAGLDSADRLTTRLKADPEAPPQRKALETALAGYRAWAARQLIGRIKMFRQGTVLERGQANALVAFLKSEPRVATTAAAKRFFDAQQ